MLGKVQKIAPAGRGCCCGYEEVERREGGEFDQVDWSRRIVPGKMLFLIFGTSEVLCISERFCAEGMHKTLSRKPAPALDFIFPIGFWGFCEFCVYTHKSEFNLTSSFF